MLGRRDVRLTALDLQLECATGGFDLLLADPEIGLRAGQVGLAQRLTHDIEISGLGVKQGRFGAAQAMGGMAAAIRSHLDARHDRLATRDRALFDLALDSMLRGADLLQLRVSDVLGRNGRVRATIVANQKKTARRSCRPVTCYLSPRTQALLARHVAGKSPNEPLFCGQGRTKALTPQALRKAVKRWCAQVGLDPAPWVTGRAARKGKWRLWHARPSATNSKRLRTQVTLSPKALFLSATLANTRRCEKVSA